MAKNIFKEAIADAKAVREVALANAKAALEEAFTPKLQSMLSAKLSEELEEDMYDEDEKEMVTDMMYDEDEAEGEEGSMNDEEIDLEEILKELEAEEDSEEEVEEAVGYPNYRADQIQKVKHDANDINQGLNESEEFNLDSLLKEINDLEEEEEILEVEDDEKESKKDIEESKDCGCNEDKTYVKMGDMIHSLKSELKESNKAYNTVRTELNEVNLLNSKLLYVNRIFKANTLDEAQKLRVVETLDKANSVKEAKLIYETVKNTFTISSPKKNKTISKKPIRENFGMASKSAGISRTRKTAPKKAVLNESNDMVARMQKLANISKINQ